MINLIIYFRYAGLREKQPLEYVLDLHGSQVQRYLRNKQLKFA